MLSTFQGRRVAKQRLRLAGVLGIQSIRTRGGRLLKKARVRGFWGGFLGPKVFVAVILLAVIISIVSRIFSTVFTQADGQLTLLSATTTEADSISQPGLNESAIAAMPAQDGPGSTSNNPLDNSGENQQRADEWETVHMRVTAYCACERCCGEYADGITACGHEIGEGDAFAAVDGRYSFGTEMVVAGYNNGEPIRVLDRGGAIRGDRLDVFFHTHDEALQWGVKYVDVEVRRK